MPAPEEESEERLERELGCPCCEGKRTHHFPEVKDHPVPCRACEGKGVLAVSG